MKYLTRLYEARFLTDREVFFFDNILMIVEAPKGPTSLSIILKQNHVSDKMLIGKQITVFQYV